jgi:protein-tyrosine phosphatase
MLRTSHTHPIRVDAVPVRNGLLGLTFCPGKHGDSLSGAPWARDLDTDLRALREWGAGLVVTLIEPHEFDLLQVPDLSDRVVAHGISWAHLPIQDMNVPAGPFLSGWSAVRADLLCRLDAGGRVVLHCRGGLGRAGLVAALLLIETGTTAEAAIRAVREVRPGAIETAAQERYVRDYAPSVSAARSISNGTPGIHEEEGRNDLGQNG